MMVKPQQASSSEGCCDKAGNDSFDRMTSHKLSVPDDDDSHCFLVGLDNGDGGNDHRMIGCKLSVPDDDSDD